MGKIEISREWCLAAADREGDSEIGAGPLARDPTLCDALLPDEYRT